MMSSEDLLSLLELSPVHPILTNWIIFEEDSKRNSSMREPTWMYLTTLALLYYMSTEDTGIRVFRTRIDVWSSTILLPYEPWGGPSTWASWYYDDTLWTTQHRTLVRHIVLVAAHMIFYTFSEVSQVSNVDVLTLVPALVVYMSTVQFNNSLAA